MKTLKLFSAFALFSFLFISCNQDSNAGATYFLENTMTEKLVIPTQTGTSSTSITQKDVDLYLSSSSFFNRHIAHLESIEILNVYYSVSDMYVDLSSSVIKFGDMVIPTSNIGTNNRVEISDPAIILSIASKLEQEGKITFSFESNLSSSVDLEIEATVVVKGTFVH
ncbi:MAG: hypothetical protein JXQ93_08085 [Flavobacteriaceae bacterium]